jgi:D-alanine--poly(phosphoribitol) ligase subunit 2
VTEYEQAVIAIYREALDIEVESVDDDVFESGLLDSLGLVSLVAEIEERYGMRIPFETLDLEEFRTVRSLARLVEGQAA